MIGSCIINGIDIANWGMFILRGSDYDFLSFPDRKDPVSNSWKEYDGLDIDLSEIFFKEKKVTVGFFIKANTGEEFLYRLNSFYTLISEAGTISLYSREFDKTFQLRFISCPDYTHSGGMYKDGVKQGLLAVEFSMDNPLQLFTNSTILEPIGNGNKQFVEINGYDMGRFGIIVNECYNTTLKSPMIKHPLVQSFERGTGLFTSSPSKATFEAKQVIIECTMRANHRQEFYQNYEALFNNLTKNGAIQLSTFSSDSQAYYSSMQGFEKLKSFSNGVLIKFSLILTIITPGLLQYLLGMEDINFTITENDYFISM